MCERSTIPAPTPAAIGPLKGARIAILGAPRNGSLAQWLAQSAARVVASVGPTTTMLVVSKNQPFGKYAHACALYRRAEELRRAGSVIEILTEDEVRTRVGQCQAEPASEAELQPA